MNGEGNRLVQAVRDCIEEHAKATGVPETQYGKRLVIADAIDTRCRQEFDLMAGHVAKRLGEKRFEEVSAELVSELVASARTYKSSDNRTVSGD